MTGVQTCALPICRTKVLRRLGKSSVSLKHTNDNECMYIVHTCAKIHVHANLLHIPTYSSTKRAFYDYLQMEHVTWTPVCLRTASDSIQGMQNI